MTMFKIVKLEPEKWQELKTIRLEALLSDPQAFGSTYERSSKKTDEEWQTQASDPNLHYFLAKDENRVIGMVGLAKSKDEEDVYELISMYTNKEYRGRGIGKALANAAIIEAKKLGAKKVKLWVYRGSSTVDFYKVCNFVVVKEIGKDPKLPQMYHNTFVMEYEF